MKYHKINQLKNTLPTAYFQTYYYIYTFQQWTQTVNDTHVLISTMTTYTVSPRATTAIKCHFMFTLTSTRKLQVIKMVKMYFIMDHPVFN